MMKKNDIPVSVSVPDFHTHILPLMDDGSTSPEMSVTMLDRMTKAGVEAVVLTPHFYPTHDSTENFLRRREESFSKLLPVLRPDHPRLYLGAEVAYYDAIGQSEAVEALTIGGSRFLLVEMPFSRWESPVADALKSLLRRRIRPIVAHLERYGFEQKPEVLRDLSEAGVLFQFNAEPFLETSRIPRRLRRMIDGGYVDFLGSDCHNDTTRPPNLDKGLASIGAYTGERFLYHIRENAEAVLASATPAFDPATL